jgi:hypothetical protein
LFCTAWPAGCVVLLVKDQCKRTKYSWLRDELAKVSELRESVKAKRGKSLVYLSTQADF